MTLPCHHCTSSFSFNSMMAVRAGSRSVYACELSGVMVKLARDVFAANNMSDRVTLLHSLSTKLSIPKDIPKRYDYNLSVRRLGYMNSCGLKGV